MVCSPSHFYRYPGFFSTLHSMQWDFPKKFFSNFYQNWAQRLQTYNIPKNYPLSCFLCSPVVSFGTISWNGNWNHLLHVVLIDVLMVQDASQKTSPQFSTVSLIAWWPESPKCLYQVCCLSSALGLSQWLSWVCIFLLTNILTYLALLFCGIFSVLPLQLDLGCTVALVLRVWFCILPQLSFACHVWPSLKYKPLQLSVCWTLLTSCFLGLPQTLPLAGG